MRQWQQDLDRGVDTELTRRIHADAAARATVSRAIDLGRFVVETLDGAIGDARVSTQDEAIDAVESGLVSRFKRSLTSSERREMTIAAAAEWNRREAAQRAEDERKRGEWLDDHQAGAA